MLLPRMFTSTQHTPPDQEGAESGLALVQLGPDESNRFGLRFWTGCSCFRSWTWILLVGSDTLAVFVLHWFLFSFFCQSGL